jgi:protein-S-isoprenylcysteine O-methyltransferase Ste14
MRLFVALYGVISYLLFFAVFVYFIGFVGEFYVPKTLSSGEAPGVGFALTVNIGLMLLWGVQHSLMAREGFKIAIEKWVPHHIERSTYVLVSTVAMALMMYFWQPIEGIIWNVESAAYQMIIGTFFALAWIICFAATFLTDHFDLFGLRQTWLHFVKKSYTDVTFTESLFYRSIRHPMMLGLLMAFWAVPTMTVGHLLFSVGMSIYTMIGMHFEERAMIKTLGKPYELYCKRTKKIIPKIY